MLSPHAEEPAAGLHASARTAAAGMDAGYRRKRAAGVASQFDYAAVKSRGESMIR